MSERDSSKATLERVGEANVKKLASKREPCEWCGRVFDH